MANAPHIPVHLGAMQEAVKFQIENSYTNEPIRKGDVILSNHPACGGSHLPDLTIITPVNKFCYKDFENVHHNFKINKI